MNNNYPTNLPVVNDQYNSSQNDMQMQLSSRDLAKAENQAQRVR